MRSDGKFITYAHRGASEYCPENTMMSFYLGLFMGANGIETDVQVTRDGVLVLFHDDTLLRVTGEVGCVADYTYGELCSFKVRKGDIYDRIPTLEDFLSHFASRDITFAIELKVGGVEERVADAIFRYGIEERTVVTSFNFDYIRRIKEYAPSLRVGYLVREVSDVVLAGLSEIGAYELCPHGRELSAERVEKWHGMGLNVRAWGISSEEIMRQAYDAGADGMTVNFPDRLLEYIKERK